MIYKIVNNLSKAPSADGAFCMVLVGAGYGRELLMELNVLPILGPSKRITAITTIATKARMMAYSTRP